MTTSTTRFDPGAVVKVSIRFTAGERAKVRPAVILTDDAYHRSRSDAIVIALSSKVDISYYGDCDITDWKAAGLPLPTKAKGVIETIDRQAIEDQYGRLTAADLRRVRDTVRLIFGL